ncbi:MULTISPECIES: helix-turn-helix transcriptional regulator [unclassified Dehalobacter]|uniref:helix-turn-helix domain-containing protein n=1 Tax=unclassified Dehalobacter TaxID=2635733 RepID=UPI001FAA4804|nr:MULTISPECIES: helix-turn-helix transcriptional regulator [unclassified Dehalobacter]
MVNINRIKELREEMGWTQAELGDRLNVNGPAVSKYESGRTPLTDETIVKLSEIFDESADYILGISKVRKEKKYKMTLNSKDMEKIKEESKRIKSLMMTSLGMAFDGEISDNETLVKVMAALEEGMILAKEEAKEKYTPKKFKK